MPFNKGSCAHTTYTLTLQHLVTIPDKAYRHIPMLRLCVCRYMDAKGYLVPCCGNLRPILTARVWTEAHKGKEGSTL